LLYCARLLLHSRALLVSRQTIQSGILHGLRLVSLFDYDILHGLRLVSLFDYDILHGLRLVSLFDYDILHGLRLLSLFDYDNYTTWFKIGFSLSL
jgi:uncharacterized membrane protein